VAIRHTVPAGLPTGTTAGKVAGDDWRGDHLHVPFSIELILGQNTALTPAAASATVGTELHATAKSCRNKLDLSQARQARLVGMVIATGNAAAAAYKLSYATAEASTWSSGTGVADAGPSLVVGSNGGGAGVMHDSGWVNLAAGAQIDNCFLTLLVGVALGTTAPTVGFITCFFR
jgi:hypothetical protein